MCWLLLGPESWVTGDVSYFAHSLASEGRAGLAHTLVEYPLPAVGVLAIPWMLARLLLALPGGYAVLLALSAVCTDAVFAILLHRASGGSRRRVAPATVVWLLAVPALGATAYARFDLLPGVLLGCCLLAAARHPRVAAGCASAAAAVKLWPALVLPPLLTRVRGTAARRACIAMVVGVAVVVGVSTVALAGWGRLFSPLRYAGTRGLQIESVAATPAVLGWWHDPVAWPIGYASSNAFEITGPGVRWLLVVSTVASLLLVLALLAAWAFAWGRRDRLRGRRGAVMMVWLTLAAVTGLMVTGRVLSPQYLLWLLPAAAAGLVVVRDRSLVAWSVLLLVTAGLTHLEFPVFYAGLTLRAPGKVAPAVVALVLRNLCLLVLTGWAWRRAVMSLSAEGVEDAQIVEPAEAAVPRHHRRALFTAQRGVVGVRHVVGAKPAGRHDRGEDRPMP
ncbi:MAG TPA: glycosyltransferase 87 family protein [Nocardioidaceae bacterium]|nr:glycosyltransferase 87 family protein [Nocardioidaceae bacterium]